MQSSELLDINLAEILTCGTLYDTCKFELKLSDNTLDTVTRNEGDGNARDPDGTLLRTNVKEVHSVA